MAPSEIGLYCRNALLPTGWRADVRIEIKDGRILSVGAGPARPGDERAAIVVPGMANLHGHAFQRGMAGLAERRGPGGDSFWTWREAMYRFVERLAPEDLEAIAALAYAEMLEAGFTRVAEFHYLHHGAKGQPYADIAELGGRVAAAAARSGIGLTLLPVFYAQGGFGAAPTGAAQARFVNDPDGFARLFEASRRHLAADSVLGIAPHSLRAVTLQQLQRILPLATGGPVHVHIAEQRREVEECLAFSGQRPVQYLFEHLPVGKGWCLVHATHISAQEGAALAASGAVAGLCPITEANLGDGLFPLRRHLEAGGVFGIGSDSNVLISLAEELRLLEYGQRLTLEARNVGADREGQSTGRALFEHALRGGAQACGVASGIEAGAPADLVELDAEHPSLLSRQDDGWLDGFIFARGAVQSVWRGGRKLVADGRHVGRAGIVGAYKKALARILD
jgi:formimidoylglutamate deiminase